MIQCDPGGGADASPVEVLYSIGDFATTKSYAFVESLSMLANYGTATLLSLDPFA